jgi:tetratricopeptide (TPR) repeat protein
VLENPTIRHLWPLSDALSPPPSQGGVTSRPLVNLSLALNYAWGGTDVRGYHVFNIAVHACSALLLFGIVRRIWPSIVADDSARNVLAFAVALAWALHPLQTETVTCVIQRTESIAAFFFLLTLYCFIRGASSAQPARWFTGCVAACLAGMASKETMVTAPLAVLLCDRTFFAGSWAAAWRRRRWLYTGLAATWLLLGWLVLGSPHRAGTAGFGVGISSWDYLLTQCRALVLYLGLVVWPHPLVVDYGTTVVSHPADVVLEGVLILALLAATFIALRRWPSAGFVAAMFFLLLAPSSSFVPLASQSMAEHRMYLPLAAIVVLVAVGLRRLVGTTSLALLVAVAVPALTLTIARNRIYASELSLWRDTVAHQPDNARARVNLGNALAAAHRVPEAIAEYEAASRLGTFSAGGHANLAAAFLGIGQPARALEHANAAVQLAPQDAGARLNLGLALAALDRPAEAIPQFEQALQLEPDAADVRAPLGRALLQVNRNADAIAQLEAALRTTPHDAAVWCDLGRARLRQGDRAGARRAAERALAIAPDSAAALSLLGSVEAADGNFSTAVAPLRRALELDPDSIPTRNNLANVLLMTGAVSEAIDHYRRILAQHPDDRAVRENLEHALDLQRTRPPER